MSQPQALAVHISRDQVLSTHVISGSHFYTSFTLTYPDKAVSHEVRMLVVNKFFALCGRGILRGRI